MVLKKSQGKEFFEQSPDCKQIWDHEQSNRFLFNLTVISRSGTFSVVKQDYFKEIPGSCNQFLILMETACDIVHTG